MGWVIAMWWVTLGEWLESKMESNRRVKALVERIGKVANYKHAPIVFTVVFFAAMFGILSTCDRIYSMSSFGIRR